MENQIGSKERAMSVKTNEHYHARAPILNLEMINIFKKIKIGKTR